MGAWKYSDCCFSCFEDAFFFTRIYRLFFDMAFALRTCRSANRLCYSVRCDLQMSYLESDNRRNSDIYFSAGMVSVIFFCSSCFFCSYSFGYSFTVSNLRIYRDTKETDNLLYSYDSPNSSGNLFYIIHNNFYNCKLIFRKIKTC